MLKKHYPKGETSMYAFKPMEELIDITLTTGKFFGEDALLQTHKKNSSVVALTVCFLYVLDNADFQGVLEDFPDCRELFEVRVCAQACCGCGTTGCVWLCLVVSACVRPCICGCGCVCVFVAACMRLCLPVLACSCLCLSLSAFVCLVCLCLHHLPTRNNPTTTSRRIVH